MLVLSIGRHFKVEESLQQQALTVTQLNRTVYQLLASTFTNIWVEGEISNLSQPSSGHLYFSLKDQNAQVRCALFRTRRNRLNFNPEDGMHVLVRGNVSLYEPRGDYQLIVEHMEETGDGKLKQAFEQLLKKLKAEGLFEPENKKPLPILPTTIGVITSPSGAAIRDILSVLKRRFSAVPIIIYPVLVQGDQAAKQIVQAIELANIRKDADCLILARGGGSLEDLWPFNEEIVARAIFASKIPIISGVGHEVDITIADLVADYRAATPSAAAEHAVPDGVEWVQRFLHYARRLQQQIQTILKHAHLVVANYQNRIQHPGRRLQLFAQQLDHFEQALQSSMKQKIFAKKSQLINLSRALDAISPLATLDRGYAIVTHADQIVREALTLQVGDEITARLAKGRLVSRISEIVKD